MQGTVRRSRCTSSHMVTYAESETKSTDSDYQPTFKSRRDKNAGLREPSKTRLKAQEVIQASKVEKSIQSYPPLPNDAERDKQYPHCATSFYYHEGLKTHLSHAHANIVDVKCINIGLLMGSNGT